MLTWFDANFVSLINGLAVGMLIFLMASGLSLIFGQADVLNLAHGSVYMIGAYVASTVAGTSPTISMMLVAIACAAVLGGLSGVGLAAAVRPLAKRGHLDQALLTLGIALIMAEVIAMIWGNDVRSVAPPEGLAGAVEVLGYEFPIYRLIVIAIGLIVGAALYLSIERTSIGSIVRAGVEDSQMLAASGINPRVVSVAVFVVGGTMAAVAGVIGAPLLGASPGLDNQVLILALITVTIGGLGSIKGAFVGALVIGQVQVLGVVLLPEYAAFLLFAAMVAVLVLRPSGLFALPEKRHA